VEPGGTMMPKFWKYLITTCNGSAFCLVAESDRDSVEKELEADPRLLKYHAKPQIERSVTYRLSVRVLRHFARVLTHKSEVTQMHDAVVTINNTSWPAYRKRNGTLVDLRILDPDDRSPKPRLVFRPEKLRELGVPAALIEAAEQSEPQGFVLFEDLPNQADSTSTGCTTEASAETTGGRPCCKRA
jgi:hypothetical protein